MPEQYFANNRKVGDGVTTVWDFSFAGARPDAGDGTKTYLEQTDVRVALVDYDAVGLETRTEITFELIGPSQVLVEPAIPSGQEFVIYRKTQGNFVISDFVDFASISERDLDDAFRQGLFAVQELRDESADTRRDANEARRDTAAALDVISEFTGSEETLRELARKSELAAPVLSGLGALLVRGSVIYVDTVADLQQLDTSKLVDGQQGNVKDVGLFVYEAGGWRPQSVNVRSGAAFPDNPMENQLYIIEPDELYYYTGSEWQLLVSGEFLQSYVDLASDQADRAAQEVADGINLGVSQVTSFVTQEADRAETARDAAFVNADVYPDIATGRAAVADGEQFQVVVGEEIIRYRRDSSSAQTEVARYPAASAVIRPTWAKNYNLWPYPIFRGADPGALLFGRTRFSFPTGNLLVSNPHFKDGNSIQYQIGGGGPAHCIVYLDEVGLAPGDRVSFGVYASLLEAGAGALYMAWAARRASGSTISSGSFFLTRTPGSASSVNAFTIPEGTHNIRFYLTPSSDREAPFTHQMHALWVHKGEVEDTPKWPTSEVHPVFNEKELGRIEDTVDAHGATLSYAFDQFGDVESTSESLEIELTNPSASTAYGSPFTGWGEDLTASGVSFNAVRVRAIARPASVDPENYWSTLHALVRSGGNVIALGETKVMPDSDILSDVTIILRDPETREVKTLSDLDFVDGEYLLGIYARNAEGGPAYCAPPRGVLANNVGQSRYTTVATAVPESWLLFSANWRLGADHLLLENPQDVLRSQPSKALRADIGAADTSTSARGTFWGRLPNYDARIAKQEAINIGWLGDSWVNTRSRGHSQLRGRFDSAVGVSGAGYAALSTTAQRPDGVSLTLTGDWTHSGVGNIGPDAYGSVSTSAGSTAVVTPSQIVDRYVIHYLQQPGGGEFSYRVGSGEPTTVSTDGAEQYITLGVLGDEALTLEVVSAGTEGVTIAGVDSRNDTPGAVVIHKLGNSGARVSRFLNVPSDYHAASLASLDLHVAILEFATNEQAGNVTPEAFRSNLEELADRILSACPQCDILLAPAGPNARADLFETVEYADAAYALATERGWAFADSNMIYGTFADADARGLYSDDVHPNSAGGSVKARAWWREFFGGE